MSRDAERRLAERVRAACSEAAQNGYESAAIAGLCHEGAWEAALSAIQLLDLRELLDAEGTTEGRERSEDRSE